MCFDYNQIAITLWPVIAKICDVITRIYDENFGFARRYAALFVAFPARVFDLINICHQIILLNQFIQNNK